MIGDHPPIIVPKGSFRKGGRIFESFALSETSIFVGLRGQSIAELRQVVGSLKAVFLAFCTQNRKIRSRPYGFPFPPGNWLSSSDRAPSTFTRLVLGQ